MKKALICRASVSFGNDWNEACHLESSSEYDNCKFEITIVIVILERDLEALLISIIEVVAATKQNKK